VAGQGGLYILGIKQDEETLSNLYQVFRLYVVVTTPDLQLAML
jgi:hypothetical protein